MSAHPEKTLYEAVHGREALHLSGRLEAPHLALAHTPARTSDTTVESLTIGNIERTRFAGIPLAALDTTVARPL
jgi:hypothetical protein